MDTATLKLPADGGQQCHSLYSCQSNPIQTECFQPHPGSALRPKKETGQFGRIVLIRAKISFTPKAAQRGFFVPKKSSFLLTRLTPFYRCLFVPHTLYCNRLLEKKFTIIRNVDERWTTQQHY
jgi:hypothetical protein